MTMDERAIPWWRKALSAVTRGIRSAFGLLPRQSALDPEEPMTGDAIPENREEDKALTLDSPDLKIPAAVHDDLPEIAVVELAEPFSAPEAGAIEAEPVPVEAVAVDECEMADSNAESVSHEAEPETGSASQ
jgi:hypothetical protein